MYVLMVWNEAEQTQKLTGMASILPKKETKISKGHKADTKSFLSLAYKVEELCKVGSDILKRAESVA